jgi:hypothetical protein
MRALAHIPLLCIDHPTAIAVIGFGVGNTTQAVTLHPSVQRVDVVDLSRDILNASPYFSAVHQNVLSNPRVHVFVNDGRQHLQMQPRDTYDLIVLEPPPIAHAGVGSLYSREFYQLARTRLKPKGYVSQWLPAYQVTPETTLSMIRAFLDVFPHAVLLSGAQPNLQLVGINADRLDIDPDALAAALARAPAVEADLQRVNLGTVREIIGTFVGSERTLAAASANAAPVTDDKPSQEYSVGSLLNFGLAAVPSSIVDLSGVAEWCSRCFVNGVPSGSAEGLDRYLGLLARAYMVPSSDSVDPDEPQSRQMIENSDYLRMLYRNAAQARNDLGIRLMSAGRVDAAIDQFQEALRLQPELAAARRNLLTAQSARTAPNPRSEQ